ncbi:hypothetical protein GQL56_09295 [Pseudomonas putida]|nr:hypothetical protein [Pseudomonas putida]
MGTPLGMVLFVSADNTLLFGGFRQGSNSTINPLGNVALGVAQQQAGVVDIGDLRSSLRANVAELELTDPAVQHLVTEGDLLLHGCLPGVITSMAEHGAVTLFRLSASISMASYEALRSRIFLIRALRLLHPIDLKRGPQFFLGILLPVA